MSLFDHPDLKALTNRTRRSPVKMQIPVKFNTRKYVIGGTALTKALPAPIIVTFEDHGDVTDWGLTTMS